jgi:oligosaccharyltransferase complex subunit alpha (ribophorin I)
MELMRSPETFSQSAIRGFLAQLPLNAHSIYFKDAIGNISSSQIRGGLHTTEVILTPRYPLFGGWKSEFTLGYSLPLEVVLSRSSPWTP